MRICFIASEVAPFAKTGGLADVAGSHTPAFAVTVTAGGLALALSLGSQRLLRDARPPGS